VHSTAFLTRTELEIHITTQCWIDCWKQIFKRYV